ncbi:MAG: response regulator [Bacteroidia bacterium]
MKVVQIDDDIVNNMAVERLSRKAGYTNDFINFTDPTEALNFFKTEKVEADLIILDINMPKLSGWDLLEHFTILNINIPIVMVTSSLDVRERKRAADHPLIKGFFVKPLSVDTFKEIIEKVN